MFAPLFNYFDLTFLIVFKLTSLAITGWMSGAHKGGDYNMAVIFIQIV